MAATAQVVALDRETLIEQLGEIMGVCEILEATFGRDGRYAKTLQGAVFAIGRAAARGEDNQENILDAAYRLGSARRLRWLDAVLTFGEEEGGDDA